MVIKYPQATLDAMATALAATLTHLTVGTGDDAIQLSTTDLETAVQIGSSDRNKAIDSNSVTDNSFQVTATLQATEPNSQPVNLRELGFQSGLNTSNDLRLALILPSSQTKDNASRWTIRASGSVEEQTE